MTEGTFIQRNRLPLLLLFIVVVVLAVISLVKFGTALFVIPLYVAGTKWVCEVTGLNVWVARSITLVLIIPLLYLVRWMFAWDAGKRRAGMSIFCALAAGLCLAVFFIRPVDPEEAYYCIHPLTHKILIYDHPGTDPQYGLKLHAGSPMIMAMEREGRSILDPAVAKFDTETGRPLFGYIESDGAFQLYPVSQPFDPQTGQAVQPLTPEVAEKLLEAEKKPEFKQCIECEARNGPDAKFCHGCGRPL